MGGVEKCWGKSVGVWGNAKRDLKYTKLYFVLVL